MGALLRVIRELLHEAARDLAPTLIVVVIFQAFFIQRMPDSPAALIGGFADVLIGLALFVKGLDAAIFPAGETMAKPSGHAPATAPAAHGAEDAHAAGSDEAHGSAPMSRLDFDLRMRPMVDGINYSNGVYGLPFRSEPKLPRAKRVVA